MITLFTPLRDVSITLAAVEIIIEFIIIPIIIAFILQKKCKNIALKITLQFILFFPLAIYNIIKLLEKRG